MQIKCLIFDADGVVINSEMFSVQYSKKFNISYVEILFFFKGVFQDCLIGKADLRKVIKPYLKNWRWTKSVDNFLKFWFTAEHKIDQRIIDIIKQLRAKDIKCYLATNQEKYRLIYMLEKMDFANIFNSVFCSAEIGHKKDEREFYEFIFKHFFENQKIKKEEIIFIDDSETNIKTARDFGFKTYFYTNFADFKAKFKPLLK